MKNMDKIYFAKVKEDAMIPSKNVEDAGMDVYACFEEDFIEIKPGEVKMIPTGIASACSEDYYLQLQERGSTGTKGLSLRCGVIDSGYRGEWFVPINNTTSKIIAIVKDANTYIECAKKEFKDAGLDIFLGNTSVDEFIGENVLIYPYTKGICQAVLLPVPKVEVEEVTLEELHNFKSKRGEGCLGDSGK